MKNNQILILRQMKAEGQSSPVCWLNNFSSGMLLKLGKGPHTYPTSIAE